MASIGIIGGMGPLATVRLFEEIVLHTAAARDQEHIRIFIDNNPQIPDRTSSILEMGPDPSEEILATARNLLDMKADILIMPCNTAHYFADRITEVAGSRFVNMIEETARFIQNHSDQAGPVGPAVLLATLGTYEGRVYESIFTKHGLPLVIPTEPDKAIVSDLITRIKGGNLDEPIAFIKMMRSYVERGLDHFILGCTELSVANRLFTLPGHQIDPLLILARAAILKAGATVDDQSQKDEQEMDS